MSINRRENNISSLSLLLLLEKVGTEENNSNLRPFFSAIVVKVAKYFFFAKCHDVFTSDLIQGQDNGCDGMSDGFLCTITMEAKV